MTDDETTSTVLRAHKKNYWTFIVMILLLWLIDLKWVELFVFCIVN